LSTREKVAQVLAAEALTVGYVLIGIHTLGFGITWKHFFGAACFVWATQAGLKKSWER
jgi:hypothetical protein